MTRYLGIGKQTGFGTGVSPTKFVAATSVSLTPNEEREFPHTIADRAPLFVQPSQKYSELEAEMFLWPEGGLENILHAFFQNVTTTTLDSPNGVYRHTFTPTDFNPAIIYYTFEAGYDPDLPSLRAPNCVVNSLEFSFASDSPPTLSVAAVGDFPSAVSRAAPSFPAVRPLTVPDTAIQIGDSAAELQELAIELKNNVERVHDLAGALRALEFRGLEVSGSLSVRFRNTTHLDNFLNREETSLKVTLTGPVAGGSHNYSLEIEFPRIVYDTWSAEISEADLLVQDVDFRALKPASGDVAVVRLVNRVSSI
jgi:hypothetical protein